MTAGTRRHPVARTTVLALSLMLVLFPKGGVRIAGLPITWGYVLLFLSFVGLMPYRMLVVKARYIQRQIAAIMCLFPYILLLIYFVLAFGFMDNGARTSFISMATSLVFLPMMFLWFYPPMMPIVDGHRMMRIISMCMLVAAIFGIFLFVWKPLTGSFIQIPYITVNADDAADFDATKNISRGFLTKLISTYNNGNLYGAATIILLPLFDLFSPLRWKRWTMRVALVLTLSRTVWAALIFNQLLEFCLSLYRQRHTFPRVRMGRTFTGIAFMSISVPVFIILLRFAGLGSTGFLLDPTLGGRTLQFQQLGASPWVVGGPTPFALSEVIYLSAITAYGRIGLPVITLIFLSPVLIAAFDRSALNEPSRRSALRGLILYAFTCTSDGALGLIPVMVFYWFTYMIFLFGVPGMDDVYPTLAPGTNRRPLATDGMPPLSTTTCTAAVTASYKTQICS